ncbi:MAG: transcription termination factor NusA [Candidatus Polarisedimenticolia bacterium]|nr:transcription termination factor NusA [bacterium]
MQNELLQAIDDIGRDKGIDREVVIKALEEAYAAASRKVFRSRENIVSVFDQENGTFRVYALKRVVADVEDEDTEISLEDALEIDPQADFDMELRFDKPCPELGRIAAQAAKQVIYQKVKEAEREKVYNEYIDRVGELINGVVKRVERGDVVVDLGSTEGAVPRREQIRAEHCNPGDRVRAVIVDVEKSGKGPQVILSRSDPRLVMKLFEMEVPEIYDGTVRIVSTARDAGERTKIAVQSRDRDVDPVGACVGMKGSRVQSVIRELRGEKIDIVQYHEDGLAFVREALKPAAVNRVALKDEERREVEVIVADDQLSLAIGKKGQNVRLAGKLVGWRIDIKSESEKLDEVEAESAAQARAADLFTRLGADEELVATLIDYGYRELEQLIDADLEDLTAVPGIDTDLALELHDKAETLAAEIQQEEEEAARLAAELSAGAQPDDASLDVAEFLRDVPPAEGKADSASTPEADAPGRDEE